MILFDLQYHLCLHEYGILIPVNDSRVTNTLRVLGYEFKNFAYCEQEIESLEPLVRYSPIIDTYTSKISRDDLKRVHDESYLDRLFGSTEEIEGEVVQCFELIDKTGNYYRYDPKIARRPLKELVDRVLGLCGGTYQACLFALEHRFCFFMGGGFHHAHFDHGSGFCLLNDIVIGAKKLLAEGRAKKIIVIDIDVHKGDGTAALCQNEEDIVTLSIHMANGWPLDDENKKAKGPFDPAFLPSDIDVEIATGHDRHYIPRLSEALDLALAQHDFDFAIVVDGSDPYEFDELPSSKLINLSLDEMLKRDRLVYEALQQKNIAQAWLMAGGYGRRSWEVYAKFLSSIEFAKPL